MGDAAGRRRDFEGLERRRMAAAELLKRGVSQSAVARRLGVHRQSVIRWARQLAQSGRAGLKQAGRAGRKPRLSGAQLKQIEHALKRGPEALGYASRLGSAGRVRELIEDQGGYQAAHGWRTLRRLGWRAARVPPGGRWRAPKQPSGTGRECAGHGLKKRAVRGAPSSSSTRAGGASCPLGCAAGPRADRPRCCHLISTGRSARPSPAALGGTSVRRDKPARCRE
jgi:transposase